MKVGRLFYVALLLFFLLQLPFIYHYTLDDSYITLRYSQHLATGNGLVWNIGDMPVEGYTSFLAVLINTVPFLIGTDPITFIKVIGVVATVLTAIVISNRLSKQYDVVTSSLFLLLFFANPGAAIHAVSGMETALAALLLSVFFLAFLENWPLWWTGLLALLCGLVRPEFNLVVLIVFINKYWGEKNRKHFFCKAILPYMALGGLYFLFRWSYFDHLFPLPFYIKHVNSGFMLGYMNVLFFTITFFPLILWAATAFRTQYRFVAIGCLSLLVYFLFPEHIMGGYHRFLYPIYPALCMLAATSISASVKSFFKSRSSSNRVLIIALAIVIVMVVNLQIQRPTDFAKVNRYQAGMQTAHIPLSKKLASQTKGLIAISDAGAIPFYSKWDTVDIFGLNDPAIALRAQTSIQRIVQTRPSVVVLISKSPTEFHSPLGYENDVYPFIQQAGYGKTESYKFSDDYYLWVMTSNQPNFPPNPEVSSIKPLKTLPD